MTEHEARAYKKAVDRRLLILYGILIAMVIVFLGYLQYADNQSEADRVRFEHAAIKNCEISQANTISFNKIVDRIITSVKSSTELSPDEKTERVEFYTASKQTVPDCPSEHD